MALGFPPERSWHDAEGNREARMDFSRLGLIMKEVDTTFDAFYLVHRHAGVCPKCTTALFLPTNRG
jgi:hypothetical protein